MSRVPRQRVRGAAPQSLRSCKTRPLQFCHRSPVASARAPGTCCSQRTAQKAMRRVRRRCARCRCCWCWPGNHEASSGGSRRATRSSWAAAACYAGRDGQARRAYLARGLRHVLLVLHSWACLLMGHNKKCRRLEGPRPQNHTSTRDPYRSKSRSEWPAHSWTP